MPGIVPPITGPLSRSSRASIQTDGALSAEVRVGREQRLAGGGAGAGGGEGVGGAGEAAARAAGRADAAPPRRSGRAGSSGNSSENSGSPISGAFGDSGQDVVQPLRRQPQRQAGAQRLQRRLVGHLQRHQLLHRDRVGRQPGGDLLGEEEELRRAAPERLLLHHPQPGVDARRHRPRARRWSPRPAGRPPRAPGRRGRARASACRSRRSPRPKISLKRPCAVRRASVICQSRSWACTKPRPKKASWSVADSTCGTA